MGPNDIRLAKTSGPIKPLSLYKNEENKYKMRPISIFFMKVAYKVMQREVQYIFELRISTRQKGENFFCHATIGTVRIVFFCTGTFFHFHKYIFQGKKSSVSSFYF